MTGACRYPECATSGECPVVAARLDGRCRERVDPGAEAQRALDALLPLGLAPVALALPGRGGRP